MTNKDFERRVTELMPSWRNLFTPEDEQSVTNPTYRYRLWDWAAGHRPDGVLKPEDTPEALAAAVRWPGAPEALYAAFLKAGVLVETGDGGRALGGWNETRSALVAKFKRDRKPMTSGDVVAWVNELSSRAESAKDTNSEPTPDATK